jgi:hypothetical protein
LLEPICKIFTKVEEARRFEKLVCPDLNIVEKKQNKIGCCCPCIFSASNTSKQSPVQGVPPSFDVGAIPDAAASHAVAEEAKQQV